MKRLVLTGLLAALLLLAACEERTPAEQLADEAAADADVATVDVEVHGYEQDLGMMVLEVDGVPCILRDAGAASGLQCDFDRADRDHHRVLFDDR